MCVCFAILHVGLSLLTFYIPYMCVNVKHLSFSFCLTSLCIVGPVSYTSLKLTLRNTHGCTSHRKALTTFWHIDVRKFFLVSTVSFFLYKLCVCVCVCVCGYVAVPMLVCSCCHFLLQVIFPTQGWNLGVPHYRQILYNLNHRGCL